MDVVEFGTDRMEEDFNILVYFSRAANSGKGKSHRTIGEGEQGIAPTLLAGEIPAQI